MYQRNANIALEFIGHVLLSKQGIRQKRLFHFILCAEQLQRDNCNYPEEKPAENKQNFHQINYFVAHKELRSGWNDEQKLALPATGIMLLAPTQELLAFQL